MQTAREIPGLFLILHRVGELHPEAAAAAAGLGDVGVLKRESALVDTVVEVDCSAVEVQVALLIDSDLHAVLFDDEILCDIGLVIEAELVLEAAATAAGHADPQNHALGHFLLVHDPLDFLGCVFGDFDHGSCFSCVWKGRVELFEVRGLAPLAQIISVAGILQ